jgi:hypothetical protein
MRQHTVFVSLGVVAFTVISFAQVGCDARAAALKLFASKGLNLLNPARDYIQPGGLVFLAKGGVPQYDDPADPVTPEPGNLINFQSDIMQETQTKTSKLSAALFFATSIIPNSISASLENDNDVSLKEIATTGVRLNTNALDELIAQPNTKRSAYDALDPKGNVRVFVVQEVYKAKSLDLSASPTKALSLKYDNGDVVADCSTANNSDKTNDSSTKSDTTPKTSDATTKKNDTTSNAPAKATDSGSKGAGNTPAAPDGTSKLQAGLAACISDKYTLKMNATDPIPFAVRLAELERYGTSVRRSRKGKPVYTTLGAKTEIGNGMISDTTPVVDGIIHRTKTER